MKHIAVIGAGITGVTTCYSLLQRGYSVTVFDKHRYAAMQTSFANGGQLSASNAEVWTQSSTILKGIKWMLRKDAPLLVNPKPDWHKYSWMAEFMSNIPHYEKNTIESARLAIAAREHLFSWAERENIEFDHQTRGILHMYQNQQGFEHATRVNKMLADGGLERKAVTVEEMKAIEPALGGDLYAGYYTPSDSTGDIHKYTRGLAAACVRLGATFVYDSSVQQLHHDGAGVRLEFTQSGSANSETESYDGVVICAGIESRRLGAQLGDRVNIYPVKGYSITVNLPDEESQSAAAWVSLLDDDAKVVTSRLGKDRFRIAGTAEFNGVNYDIRDDRIRPLIDWCRRYFPRVDTEHVVPWAGLRPMMPNMMPRVGAGKLRGVYYNTGHGHLGWTLSAATAEAVGDVVMQSMPVDRPEGVSAPVWVHSAQG
ncbi:D-amino acid dehydrogenase [Granulosicoccus antarcticus]|uniref:D-amino acid dehydrogenase n=1 Tax=Granulosicoccus antarcticus IMCC3135 TaxID=1192854 RepID=A0A2Z2NXN5_9GAMM|nr:D-amino acid dehydrogenase [Granulosicoccus antarcticus]ASJ76099.1 D-amino acid dehydrogenase [Granulosicoccus antarcticus IMCC3135]